MEILKDRRPYVFGEIFDKAKELGIKSRRTINQALHWGMNCGIIEKLRHGQYAMTRNGFSLLKEKRKNFKKSLEFGELSKKIKKLSDNEREEEVFILKDKNGKDLASAMIVFTGDSMSVNKALTGKRNTIEELTGEYLHSIIYNLPPGIEHVEMKIGANTRRAKRRENP